MTKPESDLTTAFGSNGSKLKLVAGLALIAFGVYLIANAHKTIHAFDTTFEHTNIEDVWIGVIAIVIGAVLTIITTVREVGR